MALARTLELGFGVFEGIRDGCRPSDTVVLHHCSAVRAQNQFSHMIIICINRRSSGRTTICFTCMLSVSPFLVDKFDYIRVVLQYQCTSMLLPHERMQNTGMDGSGPGGLS